MLHHIIVGVMACCFLVFGCGEVSKGDSEGSEGGACYKNGTCDPGLKCLSSVCVRLPDGGGLDLGKDMAGPDQRIVDLAPVDGPVLDAPPADLAGPEASIPDQAVADGPAPDSLAPDSVSPPDAKPDAPLPDSSVPDMATPDSAMPDSMTPDSTPPDLTVDSFIPPTGSFISTGNMSSARIAHTAVALKNGKVLIAGGAPDENKSPYLDTAELYDEAKGTFSLTGKMTSGRSGHAAALLADGKVLVSGGMSKYSNSAVLDTAEIYDPATGKFTATGAMKAKRRWHRSITLASGKVLIVGGDMSGSYHTSAEIYDPKTGKFTATGSIKYPRIWFSAAALTSGKVVIIGGNGSSSGGTAAGVAEIYDENTGLFVSSGTMMRPRWIDTGIMLPDGTVLLAGGSYFSGKDIYLKSAEVFDPAKGTFGYVGSMTSIRTGYTATRMKNGEVLLTGGYNGSLRIDTAELYGYKTGKFAATGKMTSSRHIHAAALLPSGRVLVAGGIDHKGAILKTAELYVSKPANIKTKQVLVDNTKSTAALKDFQVLVTLDHKSLVAAGHSVPSGADLRFYQGSSELEYWIEGKANTAATTIWLRVPSIPAAKTTTLTLQYGDLSLDPKSNAARTFDLYDDFSASKLNTAIWTVMPLATATMKNGEVVVSGSAWGPAIRTKGKVQLKAPFIIETRARRHSSFDLTLSAVLQNGVESCFMMDSDHSSNNGFVAWCDGATLAKPYQKKVTGSPSTSTWTYRGKLIGKSWSVARGSSLSALTSSTGVTLSNSADGLQFYFQANGGGKNTFSIDWYRIRKAALVEPVVSVK